MLVQAVIRTLPSLTLRVRTDAIEAEVLVAALVREYSQDSDDSDGRKRNAEHIPEADSTGDQVTKETAQRNEETAVGERQVNLRERGRYTESSRDEQDLPYRES